MTDKVLTSTIGLGMVNHVGITVSDLSASIKFYEALTGTKIENVDEIGGPRMAAVQGLDKVLIRYANVHLKNINLDLLEYVEPKSGKAKFDNGDVGAMHMCFEVDDLQAVVERMKAAGVTFLGEPIEFLPEDGLNSGFGTYVAYFEDPDGVHLELIQPQGPFARPSA
jgi:catechol 2,3-dioxygenase-like lactoylglutathione lyase family enzyme